MKEGALPGIPLQLTGAEGGIAGPVRSLAFVFCVLFLDRYGLPFQQNKFNCFHNFQFIRTLVVHDYLI